MFGFIGQFANGKSMTQTNETEIPWMKSIDELSKLLRKIGHGFRTIDKFDDSMNELEQVLNTLNQRDAFNTCHWMTKDKKLSIRNLIFVQIQTIGSIFIENEQQKNTKSLKTNIKHYRMFFEHLNKLLSSNSFNLFTNKQIKMIKILTKSVMNYTNEYQLSIVEKQHTLLKQKQNECKIDNNSDVIQKLTSKISKARLDRCEMVLKHRTDRIILILDQCYDVRNQCAMLRTAELFGIQNIWIVKPVNYKNMKVYDSISRHSQLWLTLKYFDSALECINTLKKQEKHRKIWVMDIGKDALELSTNTIDEYRNKTRIFPQYLAIVMGKEAEGPSKEFLMNCDQKVFIPQFGFCESYNVSVACALGLQAIFSMDNSIRGTMNEMERNKLRYLWYYQLVNDKEIKEEMNLLLNKTVKLDTNYGANLQNDFRRDDFKHWDSKKVNFKLRKKVEQQKKQNFLVSVSSNDINDC